MPHVPDEYPATDRERATIQARRSPLDPVACGALASALIDLGLYRQARTALKRLEQIGRNDPYLAYVWWGGYHDSLGDLKRAERWYRKAAVAEPAAYVFLGGVLARQGRFADAKKYHRLAARLRGSCRLARDEAYFNLGLILRAERRYREALVCFDHAIALDPKYDAAFRARADVRSAMKVEVPEEHSQHWRRMLDLMGPNPATAHELARAYTKRYPKRFGGWLVLADLLAGFARYDEAAKALRMGERLGKSERWSEPPDDRFEAQWGLMHQEKKDFRHAEASFRRAVAVRPSPTNLRHLGELLVIQGRFAAATPLLERAIRTDPHDPSIAYYQLGLIARARRRYAVALEHFESAIRHSPDYPLARAARRDVKKAMKIIGSMAGGTG